MLVIDAFLTLATWLPINIYITVIGSIGKPFYRAHTWKQIFTIDACLFGLMMTNGFTTPIVYFIFNSNFRVSKLWLLTRWKVWELTIEQITKNTTEIDCVSLELGRHQSNLAATDQCLTPFTSCLYISNNSIPVLLKFL